MTGLTARIWVIAFFFISIILLFSMRPWIARIYPGLPAYYSFMGTPFTYVGSFTEGKVGPFQIGSSKERALSTLSKSGLIFRIPMQMEEEQRAKYYFTELNEVDSGAAEFLYPLGEWKISTRQQGASIVYTLSFIGENLQRIKITSSLVE